jgi:HK97 family phage prohead protease
MDTKSLRVEIKDADKGEVVAIFAAFNAIDHDGDVTLPGAFEDGAKTRISAYNHGSWGSALPVGAGVIKSTSTEAQLHGQFFMNIPEAATTFQTVKAMSAEGLQEWSYGYDVLEYSYGQFGEPARDVRFLQKQQVHEVSPVLLGAGIGTRTLTTKSNKTFAEEGEAVLAALAQFGVRAADVMAMRAEKGKGLGDQSRDLLQRVESELTTLASLLKGSTEPESDEVKAALQREYLRFLATSAQP